MTNMKMMSKEDFLKVLMGLLENQGIKTSVFIMKKEHGSYTGIHRVCDKFTLSVSDDRGIGSIDAYSTVIIDDHLTYNRRIHDQKCQTVLPEITPASSTFSIIMIREE